MWNERFGNIDYKYFQLVQNYSMVEGLLVIKYSKGICKGCIIEKHLEKKFDRGKESKDTCILGLIHYDIRAPITKKYIRGLGYVLTFIDDLSIFTWVYFLKMKSEKNSKILKLPLRLLLGARSNLLYMIIQGNTSNQSFCNFVHKMKSISITLFPTHLNRVVYRKGKIEH